MREDIEKYMGEPRHKEHEKRLLIARALHDTLETLEREGVEAYLMGGIGAAALCKDRWPADRILSLDLDFLVPNNEETMRKLLAIWPGQFKRNDAKPVFKSMKLVDTEGKSFRTEQGVELDFISESTVALPEGRLALGITPSLRAHAGAGNLGGVSVNTVPPALLAMQKLYAGRGKDVDKYDLTDAASLIDAKLVHPADFIGFLQEYAYSSDMDGIASRLSSSLARLEQTEGVLALHEAIARFRAQHMQKTGRQDIASLFNSPTT